MAKKEKKELEIKYDIHKGRIRARTTVIYIDGTSGRQEAYGNTQTAAKKELKAKIDKVNAEIRYGEQKLDGEITLAQAVLDKIEERKNAYDREKGREKIRNTTSSRDMDVYRNLLQPNEISRKLINQIFPRDLEKYRKWLENAQYDKCQIKDSAKHTPNLQHYSASTLNRIIRLVVAVLDDFYRYSEHKSPTEALQPFKQAIQSKTEADFLIDDEVNICLKYFAERRNEGRFPLDEIYADMFSVALMLACRPGELRGLKKRDWDVKKRNLYIRRTGEYGDGRTKTEESQRILPVMSSVAEILERRCKNLKADSYIFPNTKNGVLSESNANKKLQRWLKEAGITKDLHFHSLRGSSGTYMLEKDVPLEVVSSIMGHSKTETTRKYYVAVSERRKREVVERMEVFFGCRTEDIRRASLIPFMEKGDEKVNSAVAGGCGL